MSDEARAIAKEPMALQVASQIQNTLVRYKFGEEEFLRRARSGDLAK